MNPTRTAISLFVLGLIVFRGFATGLVFRESSLEPRAPQSGSWANGPSASGPAVQIEIVGSNVLLTWPADSASLGFVLEGTGSLTNLLWDRVPGVTTNSILLSPDTVTQFYRLSDATVAGATLGGVVQSGGTSAVTPLPGIVVTLYEATATDPMKLDETTSDASGSFFVRSSRVYSDSIFFVTAKLSAQVELVAILGPVLPSKVTLNELTTVAASYSMAQFYRTGVIRGESFPLRLAAGMNDNLVNLMTGGSSLVLLTSPNANESQSLQITRSLANLLAECAANPTSAATFLDLAKDPRLPAPSSTPQALANVARNPAQNLFQIYSLTTNVMPYLPAVSEIPDAWTIAVKFNDSGDDQKLIGGAAYLVFDESGYGWITDNVIQGTPYSSRILIVLQPNGKPAAGASGKPRSPITGGGVLGAGYGLTIDPQGSVWVGNFGWGPETNCVYYPSTNCNGSISKFTPAGVPVSGPLGIQGGPVRAQGMASDASGNIWICSYGDNAVYVFRNGDPTQVSRLQAYEGSQPFGAQVAADGSAWITLGGGISGEFPANIGRYRLVGDQIQTLFEVPVGKALKGLSIDSLGNAWLASQGDSKVYAVAPDGTILGGFQGGGVDGPWGVTVDGEDHVWVANFGPLDGKPYSARISKLAGANPETRPPGRLLGDPISPDSGYTVLSAGSEVLLHNGTPLYGTNAPPSYDPMQRLTMTAIDRAGNLWALNNWKNNFLNDATRNPGGDGVVVFVGLAAPKR